MKKAFTMIELVFVIVILGILAAVAVPKLTATRDDAQFAQIVSNTKTVIKDIITYYIAYGQLSTIQNMTNVKLVSNLNKNNSSFPNAGSIWYKDQNCIQFDLPKSKSNSGELINPADLGLELRTNPNLVDAGGITSSDENQYSSSAFFRVHAPENNDECKKILQMATGLQGNKRMKYYNLI